MESVKHQESVVHDIRGETEEVYDYMMMEVPHGGVCIHHAGIAIMDVAWPVQVFGDMSENAPVHVLREGTSWAEHMSDEIFLKRGKEEQQKLVDGLLLAWAIACG